MALDTFKVLDDEQDHFNFHPTVDEATALNAMGNALAARGMNINALNQEQTSILTVAAYRIEALLEAQVESLEEAQTFLGDSVELISEDNLQSTDCLKLTGLATQDGKIVLDSALVGDTFRETLVEEMAELAFYAAFETTSKGDFGAEVEARIEGDATAEVLTQLSSDTEADTVQTAFGEGQANVSPWESKAQFYAEEVFSPQGVSVETIQAQLNAWNGAQGYSNLDADGQVFFNPSTVQKVEGTENLMNVIRSASTNQKDAFGLEVRNAIPEPNMDLDGDGIRSSTVEALLIDKASRPAWFRTRPSSSMSGRLGRSTTSASALWRQMSNRASGHKGVAVSVIAL